MRRSRVLIASSLAATVALALTACGDNPEVTAGGAEKIVIDVSLADYELPNFLDPIRKFAKDFGEAHPEYEINIQASDFRTLPETIAAAAAQGNPPDIAQYFYHATQEGRDARTKDGAPLFTSVEEAIGGRDEILGEPVVTDDIVPAARHFYSDDGVAMSMATNVSTAMLYSNMTLLEAAGVSKVPETWAEIEAACAAIAEYEGGPPNCITWPNQGFFFQQAVAEQGGLLADKDNGRSGRATTVILNSREMMAWVQWWKRLTDEGHYVYTGSQQDFAGTIQAFLSQQVAFTFNSSVPAEFLVGAGQQSGLRIEGSRLPRNDDVPYAGTQVGGSSLWLASGLDEKTRDGALAFMQYVNSPENTAVMHKNGGFIPVTGASISMLAAQGWFDQKPHLRVPIDQLSDARRYSSSTGLSSPAAQGALVGELVRIEDLLTLAMEDVLVRGADPFGRFTQATADAQMLLNDYNARNGAG